MAKIVILYSHPNPASYCHALLEATETALKAAGKSYIVRDLYAMNWDPVLKGSDFVALKSGTPPADIKQEQDIIKEAETIIVIHPVWWMSVPAILRGYIDRVFSFGFAYGVGANGVEGLLKGKKAVIVSTAGGTEDKFAAIGNPLKTTFGSELWGFCGVDVVAHKFLHGVPYVPQEVRVAMLENFKQEIATLAPSL